MKLFDEDTWSKVNENNKDLLQDYMLEIEMQGKAVKTRYQYMADIRGFMCWLYNHKKDVDILEMKRRDFRNFFLIMSREDISSARINRMESSIRNLLEFAVVSDDYDYENNPMSHIKGMQKEARRKIVFLSDKEVNILIDELLRRKHYQKALFVSLAYDSCGRKNELHQVSKKDFLKNSETNVVIGKRSKKFKLLYFNRTRQIASIYFKERGKDDIDSLWYSERNGKREELSYGGLYDFVTEFREILKTREGKDIDLNVHSFRHSGLQNYNDGTHHSLRYFKSDKLPLEIIQLIAHHSNSATTQGYLKDNSKMKLENALGLKL